jgi:CHAT domain-containing protein
MRKTGMRTDAGSDLRPGKGLLRLPLLLGIGLCAPWSAGCGDSRPPRVVEPRLSIEVDYRPCQDSCDGSTVLCDAVCFQPVDAETHLETTPVSLLHDDPAAQATARHREALRLLTGPLTLENAQGAVAMLETLTRTEPSSAVLWTDLAAARIVEATRSRRPRGLAAAIAAAEEALQRDSRSEAAHFNRALAATRLGLWPAADRAWSQFLEVARPSPWTEEALHWRRKIADSGGVSPGWPAAQNAIIAAVERGDHGAVRGLSAPYRFAARRWVEGDLLPSWARALLDGQSEEARHRLAVARSVSVALAQDGADPLLHRAIEILDRSATPRLRALARGHRAYGEAVENLRRFDISKALEGFVTAEQRFVETGSPFAWVAQMGRAECHYQRNEIPDALELLGQLTSMADLESYPALLGRALSLTAVSETYWNRLVEARSSYLRALERFTQAGELDNVAGVRSRVAELDRVVLGKEDLGWEHRHLALEGLATVVEPRSRYSILAETADALEPTAPQTVLDLRKAAIQVAREAVAESILLPISLGAFVRTAASLEDRREVLAHFDEARRLIEDVPDPRVRQALSASLLETEGRLYAESAPEVAVERFTQALDQLPEEELLLARARLHLYRAEGYKALDKMDGHLADLAMAVSAVDREWQEVLVRRQRQEQEEGWRRYFEHRQEIFTRLVGTLASVDRGEEALTYAELSLARDVLDLAGRAGSAEAPARALPTSRPATASEILEQLPRDTTLIEFKLLDDRLLTWVIRHGRLELLDREVDLPQLLEPIDRLDQAARQGNMALDPEALRALNRILLKEALTRVDRGERLLVVPHGPLHGVPFAALLDETTGRYLVQDHPITVAPSATFFLETLRRERSLGRRAGESALLVAATEFDRALFPGLEPVPGASREIAEAARYYTRTERLEGARATPSAFLGLAGRFDIVHFAGHAVVEPAYPERSFLLFAPGAEPYPSGALYAPELLRDLLPEARLVVLSACRSTGGQPTGAQGVSNLVRSLLGSGVPAVLGSLWDVRDAGAPALLRHFHHYYSAGEDATTALQKAQIALIESDRLRERLPLSWASFQLIGSGSLGLDGARP